MTAKHVVIRGLVQGVGYRDWLARRARQLNLDGWVRNRGDGAVEALVSGETGAVEELLRMCRRGPRLASVSSIVEELTEPPDAPGFVRMDEI
ncbi:MAG: acylphosphatase [Acetobacteraceae bacterium]